MKEYVEKYKDYVRDMRRYFHKHPELSYEEFETTKKIAEELDAMGIPYEINDQTKGCGLVGVIEGKGPGKTVALRSDIDALNVKECNEVDYKSTVDGKMHACGHDAHIAVLLGAAKMLMEEKDNFNGKVYLVFQPAEEVGTGSKAMMKFGNWYEETDNIFGCHVWSNLEAGKVNLEPGPRMAAADKFVLKVHGKSGHGSAPHETVDATVVAAAIVMNLQTMVSRKYSPMESVVVTVGHLCSGNRFNIISGEAVLEGTNRYYSREVGETIEKYMLQIAENTAAAFGATVELDYTYVTAPTINDEKSTEMAQEAAKKVLGEDALEHMEKVTGGEDFSFYLMDKPGCFGFIGIKNPEIGADYPHHSNHFNLDDSVLSGGSALYAQYALDFLKG